ncbi:hypothetical protein [Streptomyces sp. NPDC002676]
MSRSSLGLLHRARRWLGRQVLDAASGRTGILRAIAPEPNGRRLVAWLRPMGGGCEWTTDPGTLEVVGRITPRTHPKEPQ